MRSSWRPRANPTALEPANPLCVALDADPESCRRLASLTSAASTHKVGLTAFAAGGPELVAELAASTAVFLDLKLHDIPAQVAGAVTSISDLGARYATVHASGGPEMLRAAATAAADDLELLAVTVLTSLDEDDLSAMGIAAGVETQVARLAELALSAGIRGLVCSPLEIASLRARFGARDEGGPLLVVPGIRTTATPDDQKRTRGPRAARDDGADLLVIGRPITSAPDPAATTQALLEELGG